MSIWRKLTTLLFILCLLFTIIFFVQNSHKLSIDTNLRDLSPDLAIDAGTQLAIDELSKNIEKRLLFLVSSENKEQLSLATRLLNDGLKNKDNVTVLSAEALNVPQLLEGLSKHRFHLLTESQSKQLDNPDLAQIAKQSQSRLFRLTNAPLLPFEKDPLGWHSEYFNEFLSKINKDLKHSSLITTEDKNGKALYHKVLQVVVDRSALNLETQKSLATEFVVLNKKITDNYSVDIKRSGVFFFAADAATKSKEDISFISTVSMVGVFLVLLLTFKSVWPLLLPFVSIASGVSFAFAVSHLIYDKVHVLTIVFGASLIGIVIDYSIHYFFHHAAHQSKSAEESSKKSSNKLHSALFLSLLTSLLGYFALYFSQLDALKKVALFSCCGLTMAWLSVVCLGHFVSKNICVNQAPISFLLGLLKTPLGLFSSRVSIVFIALLGAGFLFSLTALNASDDPRLFFKPDKTLLANEKIISEITSDYEPGRFVIVEGHTANDVYDSTRAFYKQVENNKALNSDDFNTVTQWLPAPKEQLANYKQQALLYEKTGALTELNALLGVASDQNKAIVNEYKNAEAFVLQPDQLNTLFGGFLPPLWSRIDENSVPRGHSSYRNFILIAKGTDFDSLEALTQSLPNVRYFNTVETATAVLKEQRISASQLLLLAYALIIVLIFFKYKKLSALKLILVPMCATASLLILFSLTGIVFNLFHVMALFLVLGLGMDYGIFVYELQEGSVTQQAIFISAITSLLSFGLLGMSSILVAQSFGMVLFVGNIFNLLIALIYASYLSKQNNAIEGVVESL